MGVLRQGHGRMFDVPVDPSAALYSLPCKSKRRQSLALLEKPIALRSDLGFVSAKAIGARRCMSMFMHYSKFT
jgi:hypothetical protein